MSYNYKELSRFYHDLSTMVRSGLAIERSLDLLKRGQKGPKLWLLDGLHDQVMRGGSFWEGMARYPGVFDELQVMSIRAAEESGSMEETCKGLARYYEMRYKEKRRLLASLIYPVVLLHGVVLLPPLKYLVLDNQERSYWSMTLPVLLAVYGIVGLVSLFMKTIGKKGPVREKIDEFILSLPLVGKLVKSMALARVFRALSGLHNAGVVPVKAARQAIQTAGNSAVKRQLNGALEVLEHGGSFTDFFSFSGLLPAVHLGAVAVGEETGTLTESLNLMVVQMEEANNQRLEASVKALGYIAYLAAAAFVAYTVVSFYSGYFNVV
jgi:type II secretory pathway component PulF